MYYTFDSEMYKSNIIDEHGDNYYRQNIGAVEFKNGKLFELQRSEGKINFETYNPREGVKKEYTISYYGLHPFL